MIAAGARLECWDGIGYEVLTAEALGEHGPAALVAVTLRGPDDEIAIPLIEAGPVILCPADWQTLPDPFALEDVTAIDWCEIRTGAPCIMLDGWPYLSPWSSGPDQRPGSYGRD